MRITFLTFGFTPHPSGGVKVVYEYANHLATRGHDVTILHPQRWRKITLTPLMIGKSLLLNFSHTDRLLSGGRYLLDALSSRKKDSQLQPVVTAPNIQWYGIDSRVRTLIIPETAPCYVPDGDVIFWYFGENHLPSMGKPFLLLQGYGVFGKEIEDTWWRAPVPKIVVSTWLYEQALKLGVPSDQVVYIPNAFDHTKYKIMTPLENRPARIAMLYHTLPIKGAKDGIRALELAKAMFPKLQAALFGISPRPRSLPTWIEYYCNPTQEYLINSIYNGSSLYLCPSWLEGFHLAPAEAMDCGCAVVSTDIGGVRDYAQHEVTALLSPPKNPEALAQSLVRLLNDDDLRQRIARKGHQRIQEFNWERSTALLEQFLVEKTRR